MEIITMFQPSTPSFMIALSHWEEMIFNIIFFLKLSIVYTFLITSVGTTMIHVVDVNDLYR